jgi:hypothetical protein
MHKHYKKQSAYGVPCSRTASFSLARQLPTNCFDIQAFMFRLICDFMGKRGMVDERIALYEEMYTHL